MDFSGVYLAVNLSSGGVLLHDKMFVAVTFFCLSHDPQMESTLIRRLDIIPFVPKPPALDTLGSKRSQKILQPEIL